MHRGARAHQGGHGVFENTKSGHHDDDHPWIFFPDGPQNLQATHVGEADIQENELRAFSLSELDGGFGVGREAWCSDALRTMRVDRNSSPFAANELNKIRVEISKRLVVINSLSSILTVAIEFFLISGFISILSDESAPKNTASFP